MKTAVVVAWRERLALWILGWTKIIEGLFSVLSFGYFNPQLTMELLCAEWFCNLEGGE